MGISINKELTIHGTITINGAYLRLEPKINRDGTMVEVRVWSYHSKESYDANHGNIIRLEYNKGDDIDHGLEYHYFPYNRETDGVDILKFAHDKLIEYLTTDEVKEEVVVTEKLASEEQITSDLKVEEEKVG